MIRKAGLMGTISTTLGTIETALVEITRAVDTISSYNTNWAEARELDLAKSRFERDIEWMKLGQAILSTSFEDNVIQAAKEYYIK